MRTELEPLVDVDRELVALQVAELDRHRQRPVLWALKAVGVAAAVVVGVPLLTILSRAGVSDFLEFMRAEGFLKMGFGGGIAVFVVGGMAWGIWSKQARDVDARVRSIQRSWRRLTGPNWPGWTILLGLGMALGVGLPVGTLMALKTRPEDLMSGGRPMVAAMFVFLTCLWTLPAAFFVRWPLIQHLRKVVRTPD